MKRVNFNMPEECHALLKSVLALKGKNMGEYIYECVVADFNKRFYEDKQVQQLVIAGTHQPGTNAYRLKESIKDSTS